jgi:hypothetical protein
MTNRTGTGQPFSDQIVQYVWSKGGMDAQYDTATWRYDTCGTWMRRQDYGNRQSEHGWEIDHIRPLARGGSDDPENLQPLNWRNNQAKGDSYPWHCP